MRSSARWAASSSTSSSRAVLTMATAVSTRSRTIDSTSRPTYPTSVNFEASTFTKGDPASRARRRAISVFPTPVGPIMIRLLGRISSRSSSSTCWRRQRLRSAIATAFFASDWPTMYLSSSATTWRGVSWSSQWGASSPDADCAGAVGGAGDWAGGEVMRVPAPAR